MFTNGVSVVRARTDRKVVPVKTAGNHCEPDVSQNIGSEDYNHVFRCDLVEIVMISSGCKVSKLYRGNLYLLSCVGKRRATKHPLFESSWLLRSPFYQTVHSLRCISSSGLFLLMYLKITTRGCWMRCLLSHLVHSELNGYCVNDVPNYELRSETFIEALIVQTQERRCS